MASMNKGVASVHPDYERLLPKWQRCKDVVDGQDAMHGARETYLPKLTAEKPSDYTSRIKRSDFFNATWRTIAGLAGMAFRKPATVDTPAAIEPLLKDIDLAGCTLDDLAKTLVEDALEYGPFGLMVDYPPKPENVTAMTQAAAEAQGMRPLIRHYCILSVINWRYSRVGNRWQLVQVVLKEEADISEDEFERETEPRYRVLDLENGAYRQRVFRKNDKGEDELLETIVPLMNGKTLTEIPFRIVGEIDEPPLIDLVDANVAHYQVNSDYRHGLHFTGLPTLFLAGVTEAVDAAGKATPFYIGSTAAITAADPNAKGMFIEFTGQGLSETREALKSLEQRMAVLGARMIADETKQVETATATQIKRAGENSILASTVIEVSKALEWALGVFSAWAGQEGEVKYEINRDFNPMGLDAQQLTALLGYVQAGQMSGQSLFDLLQRNDIQDAELTYEDEQARIEADPAMPAPAKPAVNDEEQAA